jgi:hypothetical protein
LIILTVSSKAWSGAPQLRGEVKTLCKSAVKLFGIPGEYSPAEIAKHIKFLTGKKGIFKFGGINLQVRPPSFGDSIA